MIARHNTRSRDRSARFAVAIKKHARTLVRPVVQVTRRACFVRQVRENIKFVDLDTEPINEMIFNNSRRNPGGFPCRKNLSSGNILAGNRDSRRDS